MGTAAKRHDNGCLRNGYSFFVLVVLCVVDLIKFSQYHHTYEHMNCSDDRGQILCLRPFSLLLRSQGRL